MHRCEQAVIFWMDKEEGCLWRFTSDEEANKERLAGATPSPFGDRVRIPLGGTQALAIDAIGKVNMSGTHEQQ